MENMSCQLCGREVTGRIDVCESTLSDDTPVISMDSTPDRDWIICDSCNTFVCHNCCRYPLSGYCDTCIDKYNLTDYLAEVGLIPRKEDQCL